MNLDKLGELTGSKYDKEHCCDENFLTNDIRLLHCVSSNNKKHNSWWLLYIHYADEEEVIMGEAEYLNEVTNYNTYVVNYCPYCGANLNAA
ncbi:MAG: hypothetical protein P8171_14635 [Candidatus Thiodiazotropha sp.]